MTRGPSLDPSEKRLAVHVEDHPLDYGSFEGNIPKGQYGAGAVIVWDEGNWEPEGDPAAGMKKGHLRFELKGNKLNGAWHLVRLKRAAQGKARQLAADQIRRQVRQPQGRYTGGRAAIGEVGLDASKISPKARRRRSRPRHTGDPGAGASKPAKSKAKMPGFIAPCLARLQDKPPAGDEWVHEVKFDGYRMQARVEGGTVKLYTRTGLDWTAKFGKAIAETFAGLDLDQAIIDGEMVVLGDNGVSAFSELQLALSEKRSERMIFYVFDLLYPRWRGSARRTAGRPQGAASRPAGRNRRGGAGSLQRAFFGAGQDDAFACLPHGARRRRLQTRRRALFQRPRPRLDQVQMHAAAGVRASPAICPRRRRAGGFARWSSVTTRRRTEIGRAGRHRLCRQRHQRPQEEARRHPCRHLSLSRAPRPGKRAWCG